MELLASLTGPTCATDAPRVLIALTMVERYAKLIVKSQTMVLSVPALGREIAVALARRLTTL